MRLIDADALIEIFDIDKYERVRNEYQSGYNDGLFHAEVVADDQPTVDTDMSEYSDRLYKLAYERGKVEAVPVRHGKWEMKPDPYGFFDEIPVCSECGCTTKMREKTKYCPNCGARMDEE